MFSGLAYGALTSLHPIHGLYTILFGSSIYILFATSRHMHVGAFAIISVLVYSCVANLEAKYLDTMQQIVNNGTMAVDQEMVMAMRVRIATTLAFWCGIIQVALSVLRFGNISKYFSQPLLKGFNTAAAYHVFSNQLPHLFGIYKRRFGRPKNFKIIYVTLFFCHYSSI